MKKGKKNLRNNYPKKQNAINLPSRTSVMFFLYRGYFAPKTFCYFSFHFLLCTLCFRKTEGHGGRRHQDVCEDWSVSHRQSGGTLL